MNLIIGKNSFIVQTIKSQLKDCFFISHKDIDSENLSKYSKIYLFSWNNDYDQFLLILNKLPLSKLIFISSIAVYSNFFRKQWNNYPSNKLKVEEYVLSKKGSVLRIGIFGKIKKDFLLKNANSLQLYHVQVEKYSESEKSSLYNY